MEFIFLNWVFILTRLNFSHLQSTLHLMQYTYWDVFPLLKSFWTYQFWWLLVLLLFFVSLLPYHKMFPFEDFFHLGKQKKVTQGKIWWIGRLGRGEHAIFGQKLLNTPHGVSRCGHKSPIMKWVNALKESSEKSIKAGHSLSQQRQLYTDTEGFLEHSRSGGSLSDKGPALYKIILAFFGSPLI